MYLNTHLCNEYEIPDSKNLKFLNVSNTSHGSNKIENLFLWICYSCVFKCLYEVRRQMVIELHEAYIHTGIKISESNLNLIKSQKIFSLYILGKLNVPFRLKQSENKIFHFIELVDLFKFVSNKLMDQTNSTTRYASIEFKDVLKH